MPSYGQGRKENRCLQVAGLFAYKRGATLCNLISEKPDARNLAIGVFYGLTVQETRGSVVRAETRIFSENT